MRGNMTGGRVLQPFRPYVQVLSNLYFPTIISFLCHVEITVKTNVDLWTGKVLAMIIVSGKNVDGDMIFHTNVGGTERESSGYRYVEGYT